MKRLILGLGALGLLLAAGNQARANLIINPGFETGNFNGWTTANNSYPQTITTATVHSGLYAAQIAGYSYNPDTLSQTITTTLGQNYDLSFWRKVSLGGSTELLQVYWDGNLVFSETGVTTTPYQQFSVNVAGTGSDTLLFRAANDSGFTFLDDVSLEPTNANPVPEPASLALVGTAGICFGVAALRRRLRKNVG